MLGSMCDYWCASACAQGTRSWHAGRLQSCCLLVFFIIFNKPSAMRCYPPYGAITCHLLLLCSAPVQGYLPDELEHIHLGYLGPSCLLQHLPLCQAPTPLPQAPPPTTAAGAADPSGQQPHSSCGCTCSHSCCRSSTSSNTG